VHCRKKALTRFHKTGNQIRKNQFKIQVFMKKVLASISLVVLIIIGLVVGILPCRGDGLIMA
jgi:hypothetical protein